MSWLHGRFTSSRKQFLKRRGKIIQCRVLEVRQVWGRQSLSAGCATEFVPFHPRDVVGQQHRKTESGSGSIMNETLAESTLTSSAIFFEGWSVPRPRPALWTCYQRSGSACRPAAAQAVTIESAALSF